MQNEHQGFPRHWRHALRVLLLLAVCGAAMAQQGAASRALLITSITPSGTNVPDGRQIVIQFNRPVVPIGRMDRAAAEIPIEITPALDCQWRWIDRSALACQLGDAARFRLATRYTLVVNPGITAEDGATIDAPRRHEFTTARPRVGGVGFATWRSPGTPVIRAIFTQPVSESSVRAHLYMTAERSAARVPVAVTADEEARELPRYVRLPGERAFVDLGERQVTRPDDRPTPVAGETARRVWLVQPVSELPLDADAQLKVEPGLEPAEGELAGDESRVVVQFATFPAFRFLGVVCSSSDDGALTLPVGPRDARGCNPLGGVGLRFSAPVLGSEIRDHVSISPDLAGGRTDYDPWANRQDYSQLTRPHTRGDVYTVYLPERLKAAASYGIRVTDPAAGPKDEFGRSLPLPVNFEFVTAHRPPAYTLTHTTAVLEQGVDSEVPLYVTNLERFAVQYRRLNAAGAADGLRYEKPLPRVEDVQYGVKLGVREMLQDAPGALYGRLLTDPSLARSRYESVFAQVTPYQVHVKLGHFNTLVWVTELATGALVRNARVALYVDAISRLSADVVPLATATTDAAGVALLPGTKSLDPKLALVGYGCAARSNDDCPRLFVRVDGGNGMALLPLDYRFEINAYRASNYTVFENAQPKYGHVHSWGTTAQGVYRAGDTIDYKLYVRDQSNETLVAPPAGPYELDIIDPTGTTVQTVRDVRLSKFGAYAGTYAIPPSAPVGWYQFRLTSKFDAPPAQSPAPPAGAGGALDSEDDDAAGRDFVRYPLRVLVSDFTPSPFGVHTTLNGDLYEAGDDVVVETRATLFSGGPYVDAEARVTAQLRGKRFTSSNPVAAPFRFDTGEAPAAMVVSQGTSRVDAQGTTTHSFTLAPTLGRQVVYGTLTVEGAVRDDRGKYVASAASADFVAVDRLVGLRSTRWVFQQGQPAEVQYLVVDARGAPAAGTDVHVAIERLDTKAARVKGAGNAYLTEFIDEWVAAGSCDGRSAATAQTCVFTPEAPGSYRLTASIQDSRGRPHKTELTTWVVGRGQVVWHGGNDDAIEIVPEKPAYAIGDTARYLLKNPYPGARALVTIERYGVLKQWTQTLDGSTPVIEFPVEKDYMPGVFLSVLVMSPRVAAPLPEVGELDLGKPSFKLGYVAVPVEDPVKQIDVDVRPERAVYKPGEKVRVRVKAAVRARDRREPIEVAVAVLDESVLDLIQGGTSYFDPYAGFYTLDGLDMRNYSLLTRLVGRQKIETKGANPGGDGGSALSMRSVFKYVSYWNPSIELDARGNGSFEFTLPDNLTGWRVLVLATTPTDRMGRGQGTFKVNLPTEVRPAMPNQVTEGDRFQAAFTVMNRTDRPRDITVSIAATGTVHAPVASETKVHLAPYARTTVQTPVDAAQVVATRDQPTGRIDFAVTARDAVDADGLKHALVVNKRRSLETAANYGSFDGASVTESLRFPERIHADAGDVGVVLAPSVIGNVDGAFRYLRDYPYLCWEQRLTKGVMASHYLRLRDYLPADLKWPEAADLPAATLAQAAAFQAPNGGMTYWVPRDDYASPYLSAYTALAFAWLREDGYAIPEAVENRLHEYLDTFLKRDVAPDFYTRGMASTVRAVALAALAKRGKVGLADLERYRSHVEYMSLFGKAHYLTAALAVPGAEKIAREVEEMILQSSVRSGGKIAFNEVLDDGYLRISATPLNGNCAVLSAMTAGALRSGQVGESTDGVASDVPFELVRVITQARGNRDHWENTQENMFCMNSLVDYARRFEAVPPAMRVAAKLGDAPLGAAEFKAFRDAAVTLARPIGPADPGTAATLTLERAGAGRLYYSARMTYAPTDDAAIPVNAGMDVQREYSVQRDGKWVLLTSPMRVRRGELVRVDVFLSLPTARNFVVVDDPVPGGLEPVNRDLANTSQVDAEAGAFQAAGGSLWFRYSDWREYGVSAYGFYHQELRHDAARFYSDYLPPGNYHLRYSAQAIAEGEFAVLPTKAVEMYDPDVYGLSLPGTLAVEAAP
ncbi:MAG TPA: alpha-2-macroglobulin family protein [Gammaproteobacteria bacterium]|nr:alpha-2-macroglobulin family protein [Gammaproteobacteria bacterium]